MRNGARIRGTLREPKANAASRMGEEQMLFRSRTAALILIVVGVFFLLSNLGWIPQLRPLLHQWWPLILIIVGVLMLVRRS